MDACPQCACPVDSTRFSGAVNMCPACGATLRHNDECPWIDVARVTNLAEAGFLTDELIGLGIDARIHQLQEFSALTDHWTSQYLIRVPAEAAREAAAQIRMHQTDDAGDRDAEPAGFSFTAGERPIDPLLWRPVALVILAGVSSFVLGQRFSQPDEAKPERRPQRNSLSSAMEAIGQPLVTESARQQPKHRLSFDARRDVWLLDTDRDGDGSYDTRQAYQASGASW